MKQNKRILRAPQERAFKDVGAFATTPFIYKGTVTLGEYLVDHYKTPGVERPVKAEGTFHARRFFTLQIRRRVDSSTGYDVRLTQYPFLLQFSVWTVCEQEAQVGTTIKDYWKNISPFFRRPKGA
jgi:hypothetical protein